MGAALTALVCRRALQKKEIAGDADRITFHHLDPVREAR